MMSMRRVQPAPQAGAPLALAYLLDTAVDPLLREALPDCEVWATHERFLTPDLPPAGRRLVLLAWSAGVQTLRAMWNKGVRPDVLVALDGTAANYPTPQEWQIRPWREAAEAARSGRMCTILTCTNQTYVEQIASPYMATRHVLERALGHALTPGEDVDEGDLHVWPATSATIDGPAHIRQVTHVLPRALGVVRSFLDGGAAMDPATAARLMRLSDDVAAGREGLDAAMAYSESVVAADESPPTEMDPRRVGLGDRALEHGLTFVGEREQPPGSNTSPRIADWLAPCVRGGARLGIRAGSWCAAFFCACAWEAAKDCPSPPVIPHEYRAAVWELVRDADAAGALRDRTYRPRPGDGVVLRRGAGNPMRVGEEGHVCRVVEVGPGDEMRTLDGNHGDCVALVHRHLTDADIVAFIAYPEA